MLPSTDHVPSCINQSRSILTQYHQVPTSTAFYWPSSIKYQPVPPCIDTAPSYINQYHPILTQYHQVPTRTAPYWPSTAFYWPSIIIYHIQISDFPLSTWDEHSCTFLKVVHWVPAKGPVHFSATRVSHFSTRITYNCAHLRSTKSDNLSENFFWWKLFLVKFFFGWKIFFGENFFWV